MRGGGEWKTSVWCLRFYNSREGLLKATAGRMSRPCGIGISHSGLNVDWIQNQSRKWRWNMNKVLQDEGHSRAWSGVGSYCRSPWCCDISIGWSCWVAARWDMPVFVARFLRSLSIEGLVRVNLADVLNPGWRFPWWWMAPRGPCTGVFIIAPLRGILVGRIPKALFGQRVFA